MKTRYLVAYDIADPDRLRRVYVIMKGAGERLQYSVFQCDLSSREKEVLISELTQEIDMQKDQVLFIDLGPCDGSARRRFLALGKPYAGEEAGPVII
jgi:CRISPR-associated protein Cas2